METVMEALVRKYPDSSKNTLKSWIEEGRVYIGEKKVRRGNEEATGDVEVRKKEMARIGPLKVLFLDRDLIVIEKPAGLLSVKAAFEGEKTAHSILKEYFFPKKVYVIHRLDQDTSGVMLFGLSERSYEPLKTLFKDHAIDRIYTAVVEGDLQGEGTWVNRLEEDVQYKVHVVESGGEEAVTHYKVLKKGKKGHTLVAFKLETGKKNQIRVQSSFYGYPLAGDEKYGSKTDPIKRLALHASTLGFIHPMTGKPLMITSPVPHLFEKLIG